MINLIKSTFRKLICKHDYICVSKYNYFDGLGYLVFIDEYKCSKCGRVKEQKKVR